MAVRHSPRVLAQPRASDLPPMDFFDTLVDEHRLILRALDALEHFIAKVEDGKPLDLVELNRFVVFLREFVELVHHEKEESVLFPAMMKLGYSKAGAPIAHIHSEHQRERGLLFELRQAAVRVRPMSSAQHAHLVGLVRELIAFERKHIKKENELLYPTVKKELSGQTLEELTKKLWSGDDPERRIVEDAWLRTLAAELVEEHSPGA